MLRVLRVSVLPLHSRLACPFGRRSTRNNPPYVSYPHSLREAVVFSAAVLSATVAATAMCRRVWASEASEASEEEQEGEEGGGAIEILLNSASIARQITLAPFAPVAMQRKVAQVVAALVVSPSGRSFALRQGALSLLVRWSRSEEPGLQREATRALGLLMATDPEAARRCVNLGGWRLLASLARLEDVQLRLFAALRSITAAQESQEQKQFVMQLLQSVPDEVLRNVDVQHKFARILVGLSERPQAESLYEQPIMGPLMSWAASKDVELQKNAARALANLSENARHCREVWDHNILDALAPLAQSTDPAVIRSVARAIANLAVDSVNRPPIVQKGWLRTLVAWTRSSDTRIETHAVRALANLESQGDVYADGMHLVFPQYKSGTHPKVDIVFVHGVRGGAYKTWRVLDPQNAHATTVVWPRDWLPYDVPDIRVLSLKYRATMTSWSGYDTLCISERAEWLLDRLLQAGVGQRPIVFVAHSLGGLVVKQMLDMLDTICSHDDPTRKCDVARNTKAIVFYSTPHKGLPAAKWSSRKVASSLLRPTRLVHDLATDAPHMKNLNDFLRRHSDLKVLSFSEAKRMPVPGLSVKAKIVSQESANPGVGQFHVLAGTTHLDVCKPSSRQDPSYALFVEFVRDVIASFP